MVRLPVVPSVLDEDTHVATLVGFQSLHSKTLSLASGAVEIGRKRVWDRDGVRGPCASHRKGEFIVGRSHGACINRARIEHGFRVKQVDFGKSEEYKGIWLDELYR